MDDLVRLMAKVSLSITAFSQRLISQGKMVPLKLICLKAGLQEFAKDKGFEVTYQTMVFCGDVKQESWCEEEKNTWNEMRDEIEEMGRKAILAYVETSNKEDSDLHP